MRLKNVVGGTADGGEPVLQVEDVEARDALHAAAVLFVIFHDPRVARNANASTGEIRCRAGCAAPQRCIPGYATGCA